MFKIRLNAFHFGNTVGQNMQTALVTTLEAADICLSLILNTKVCNRGKYTGCPGGMCETLGNCSL